MLPTCVLLLLQQVYHQHACKAHHALAVFACGGMGIYEFVGVRALLERASIRTSTRAQTLIYLYVHLFLRVFPNPKDDETNLKHITTKMCSALSEAIFAGVTKLNKYVCMHACMIYTDTDTESHHH